MRAVAFKDKLKKYIIGIDVGGTSAKGGLFSLDGELLSYSKIDTHKCNGVECTVSSLVVFSKLLASQANVSYDDVIVVGMGVPGVVNSQAGVVLRWTNFDWNDAPVAKLFSEQSGKPTYIANDANVAKLGNKAGIYGAYTLAKSKLDL